MLTVPVALMALIVSFAPLFSKRVWQHAQVLLVGAILAPGKRTVTSALRVCGLAAEPRYQNYHRVLNRAAWSPLAASRHLPGLLLQTFAPTGPLLFGLDDTTLAAARRQDQRQGHHRDPVRSSHSHTVRASGLRWLCWMLLLEIGWAERTWALPFLTALRPPGALLRRAGTWA